MQDRQPTHGSQPRSRVAWDVDDHPDLSQVAEVLQTDSEECTGRTPCNHLARLRPSIVPWSPVIAVVYNHVSQEMQSSLERGGEVHRRGYPPVEPGERMSDEGRLGRLSGMLKRRGFLLPAFEIHGGAKGPVRLWSSWRSNAFKDQSGMERPLA